MNSKTLALLAVTVLAVAGAWYVTRETTPSSEIESAELFPGLLDRVNDVEAIAIVDAANETRLARDDGNWVVSSQDGFDALSGNVKRALLQLASLKIIEPKTADPANYARLGVDGPDGGSTLVELGGSDGLIIAALLVGNAREGADLGSEAWFVRRPEAQRSLLVGGNLEISADPAEWMDRSIVDVATRRVRRVVVERPGAAPVELTKKTPDENFFELQNVPAGFSAKSRATVSSMGAFPLSLRFDSVTRADTVADTTPGAEISVATFDGLVIQAKRYDSGDAPYFAFSFDYDPPPESSEGVANAESAETNAADAAASLIGATEAENEISAEDVAALNTRVDGWVYRLPDYKVRMVDKTMTDLIEEKKAEAPAPEPVTTD